MLETDRADVVRQAIMSLPQRRHGLDPRRVRRLARQVAVRRHREQGLTIKTGQTHVQRYLQPLLDRIQRGEIDPSFVITHRLPLESAPAAYEIFQRKQDDCIKVVLKPGQALAA